MKPHDIIQLDPGMDTFGGCLATVHELRDDGRLMVYIQSAGVQGQQYLFVRPGQYQPTGGQVVWAIDSSDSEGGEV